MSSNKRRLYYRPRLNVIVLADEVVSVATASLGPVIVQRPVEQQTLRCGAVDGRRSLRSPARVADRLEMMLGRPHPLLVAHHEVAARPPAVDVLVLYARHTSPNIMNLFRTGSLALVEDCQRFLNFLPASYQVDVKTVKFLQKYKALENTICSLFSARS